MFHNFCRHGLDIFEIYDYLLFLRLFMTWEEWYSSQMCPYNLRQFFVSKNKMCGENECVERLNERIFIIVCLLKINAEMLLNWLFKRWTLLPLADPDRQG